MLGFSCDMTRCTGCKTCQMACKEYHGLPVGDYFRRVDLVWLNGAEFSFSGACNHCADPACVSVCPTGAMFRALDGTVQHRDRDCIACGQCVQSCPYGAPSLNRITGYAQKCDSCMERRASGKNPICVDACPVRALHFGELEEWNADVPFLPDAGRTHPNLLVKTADGSGVKRSTSAAVKETAEQCKQTETTEHIVILGGGAAAVSAARSLRKHSAAVQITLISRDTDLPYCRPMLSKSFLNSFAANRYPIVSADWLDANGVSYLRGQEAVSLDGSAHTVTLADGKSISYDKCIIAAGANGFAPPIPGKELQGVYTLRNSEDIREIRKSMLTARHAAVIGGGITGLELAWELKRSGMEVTVLDVAPYLAERILDRRSAERLESALKLADVEIRTGVQIAEISGNGRAEAIRLMDGMEIPAELVVLSTGFRPNIALAKAAGLDTNRGIVVNEKMETSVPGVYACGDCTDEANATWLQSLRQGEAAAMNALGLECRCIPETEPAIFHTANISVMSVGDLGKRMDCAYRFLYGRKPRKAGTFAVNPAKKQQEETLLAFCFADDRLAGAAQVGELSNITLMQQAVREHWTMQTLQEVLRGEGVIVDGE